MCMQHQRLKLSLHCLHGAAFCGRPLHTGPRVFASCASRIWIPQLCITHICISDNWWCGSALKGSLLVSEAISLGAQTFAPFSPAAAPSTPFARFILHAHSRRLRPPTPACLCPPLALPLSSHSALLSRAGAKIYSVLPKRRTRLCSQAAMTVTDMYIMLSDSVRHATALPLFIWKLFITTGPVALLETLCGSLA